MQTRPILAINGTEELLQVVIGNESGVLFHAGINGPGRTMRFLLPLIDEGLHRLDMSLAHCRGIACTRGPGSSTGIRVALATIEGLARATGVPTAGLDYLPILAGDLMANWQSEAWVMTYARKDQVYIQGFSMPQARALTSPRACLHTQAVELLCSRKGRILAGGSGITRNTDFFSSRLPASVTLTTHRDTLSPEALLLATLEADFIHTPITPLYLRASDAEYNLSTIALKRGIPFEDALKRIPHQE